MFWYRDVTSWDMRWSLWRTRPFKLLSDHGHLLVSSIYLPKELNSFTLFMPWANCGVFIAGLVIRKNYHGNIKHLNKAFPLYLQGNMQFSIPDLDKIPKEKGSLAPWIFSVFEILASIEGITLVFFFVGNPYNGGTCPFCEEVFLSESHPDLGTLRAMA